MSSLKIKALKFVLFSILVINPSWTSARKSGHAQPWARTVKSGKEKITTLRFYFHDTVSTKSPSAVQIAQPNQPKLHIPPGFGDLMMADDPLTIGPRINSKLVGRAQGLYGSASQNQNNLGLVMALSYNFYDGKYNGSSISIMGRNSVMSPIREMPVVGGTGFLRMARGYAIARTYWYNSKGDAIVGYNITIFH